MGKKQLPRCLGLLRESGNPAPMLARQSSKGEHPESGTKTETEARNHRFAYPFAIFDSKDTRFSNRKQMCRRLARLRNLRDHSKK